MAWTSPILHGKRVQLRPLGPRDTDDLYAAVNGPPAERRLTGNHRAFTYEEIAAYCASRAEKTDRVTLAITDPDSGAYLGEVVLMDHDEPNRSAGLRIALVADARDRGLGSETLRLVLAHAFGPLRLHRVSLGCSISTRGPSAPTRRSGSGMRGACVTHCGGTARRTIRCSWPYWRRNEGRARALS